MNPIDTSNPQRSTEIIAFCSGKGGTGKSLLCSCLGYALTRSQQRVLLIDGDPATDGLSLFLLGPEGSGQVGSFSDENTFVGFLNNFRSTRTIAFAPRTIHRRSESDHGVSYHALISGRGLYGDKAYLGQVVPDLNQEMFREAIRGLFAQLKATGTYDYVLIDTRGGFAFESADICALADSFIVITEPDVTSFYQDRNLIASISAASELESPSLLRGIIVNKCIDAIAKAGASYLDTLEVSFRNELVREFELRYKDTYPVPVALEALMAYKVQQMPLVSIPESNFCLGAISAFAGILQIVTSLWAPEQIDSWNELVDHVAKAVSTKYRLVEEMEQATAQAAAEQLNMQAGLVKSQEDNARLQEALLQQRELLESERRRSDLAFQKLESPNLRSVRGKSESTVKWGRLQTVLATCGFCALLSLATIAYLNFEKAKTAELSGLRATELLRTQQTQAQNYTQMQLEQLRFEILEEQSKKLRSGQNVKTNPYTSPVSVLNSTQARPTTVSECLSGRWQEGLYTPSAGSVPFTWSFTMSGNELYIKRDDGFVSGNFQVNQDTWNGELNWKNGDIWRGVILTPSSTCARIETNQKWYFVKPPLSN